MQVSFYEAAGGLVIVDPTTSILGSQGDGSFLVLVESNLFHAQYYAWGDEISPSINYGTALV